MCQKEKKKKRQEGKKQGVLSFSKIVFNFNPLEFKVWNAVLNHH